MNYIDIYSNFANCQIKYLNMKKQLHYRVLKLAMLVCLCFVWNNSNAQHLYTTMSSTYTQNFDGLGTGAGSVNAGNLNNRSTTLNGWYIAVGSNFSTSLGTSTGSVNSANVLNYGIDNNRSLGAIYSSNGGLPNFGFYLQNNTGAIISSVDIAYTGKAYRIGATGRADRLDFQYSTTATSLVSGTYTDFDALDYEVPSQTATFNGGSLHSSASISATITGVNIPIGGKIFIRWTEFNATGSDDGLSIDDFTIKANPVGPAVTTIAATSVLNNGATLNGSIRANNTTMAAGFEYGTSASYGSTATGSPSSISGNTVTPYNAAVTGLLADTQYHFRAVGDNGTVYNGADMTFHTKANVPGVLLVNGAALTSLDVTINGTTANGNPSTTTYAIYESSTGKYLLANGALTSNTAVFQTASVWGTKTVTGLANNTTYTFSVKAKNAINEETALGAIAQGTTLANTSPYYETDPAVVALTFPNTCINTTSGTTASFDLYGYNLGTATTTVGPLTGYTFSVNNATFLSSLSITPSSGSILETIYVRFTPTAVQSYSGNIVISNGASATKNAGVTAAGVNTGATAVTGASNAPTSVGATLSGTLSQGCSPVTAYGFEYSTTSGFVSGTQVGATNLSAGAFSAAVSGLLPNTQYYFKAYVVDAVGTHYGTQSSFTTANLSAPTAATANPIASNGFTANWSAVTGASSYVLDVSASASFGGTLVSENFSGFNVDNGSVSRAGSLNTYLQTPGWTGAAVYEMIGYTKMGSGSAMGIITTPTVDLSGNSGNATFTFDLQRYGSDNTSVQVYHAPDGVTFTQVGADIVTPVAMTTQLIAITGGTANSKIRIQARIASNNRYYLDNISVSANLLLPGYDNLNVGNVTSYPVSGLNAETNYYYRVRAVSGSNTSANSNPITVKTALADPTLTGVAQTAAVCENTAAVFTLSGLIPQSTFSVSYTINGGTVHTVSGLTADNSGNASFTSEVLTLTNNGQTLAVTAIQRTGQTAVAFSQNNTATIAVNANVKYYVDADGDGYGNNNEETSILACVPPVSGYAITNTDCNDDPSKGGFNVNPGKSEIFYNGIDDNCDGNIDEGRQVTTGLLANRCGTTLTKIYQSVNCEYRIAGVTGYRFRIKNLDNPSEPEQITERLNAHFTFNSLPTYQYATNYSVEVMVQRNNVWLNYYGPVCTVRTPDLPKLAVCGGTVAAAGTAVFTEVLTSVTAYRFEVTNVATQQVTPINNERPYFRFSEISGFTAGGLYSVKVSVKTTGDWSVYGGACVITAPGGSSPEIPTDKASLATTTAFNAVAYPNPFANSFNLDVTTSLNDNVNVKAYDMLGKLVENLEVNATDVSQQQLGNNYPAGVYNIIVTQGENLKTLRIVKR